ncbi:pyridoxal phosphate-dependent aminotransferase [Alteromonas lipolytica]|uniref:Aminotransferase n=1 Tax=Alteromonas lipolytica TaxID=1856405 RepID=A0A1E8F8T5_9ALTE|nr:pyridoxal phosphate-dependent aminotransferase [Alteromonas lipolytica]OFI32186.1 aminotransferase [Alteromonas lipolytica]GGF83198.1 aminotransferase [Alteromonas lipolytica]
MQYSDRANAIAPFYAMSFGEKATALEAKGHSVVRLNIGEPDFGAPPAVQQAMQQAVELNQLPYTSALGDSRLRVAIADFYALKHGVTIAPQRVVVTAGASAALLLVCAALVNPGDEVMVGDPSYPCNRQFVTTFGGQVNLVPTTEHDRFQLSPALVEQYWNSTTKALMIATPSNPTGTAVASADLASMCEFAKAKGAWRIIDEIYLNLSDDEHGEPQTALAFDDDAIIINSFSKYFGMTGWRLGWMIVPEDMVEVIERLAQNLYICPSTPAQLAALACFKPETLALCETRRASLLTRRQIVLDGLAKAGLPVPVPPDGAFYVYIDVSGLGMSAMAFCERLLEEAHVALTPGNDFGPTGGDQYVRLSYATAEEQLHEGLARIAKFTHKLKHSLQE